MATIRKEIPITASADKVWDVIRDVGAIHIRLAPGFVVDTRWRRARESSPSRTAASHASSS